MWVGIGNYYSFKRDLNDSFLIFTVSRSWNHYYCGIIPFLTKYIATVLPYESVYEGSYVLLYSGS